MTLKKITLLSTCLILLVLISNAQTADSLQKVQVQSVKTTLNTDDATAKKVSTILSDYKIKAKTLAADNSLSTADKKTKFDALMDDKNTKLRQILSAEQVKKIVPTTELNKKSN